MGDIVNRDPSKTNGDPISIEHDLTTSQQTLPNENVFLFIPNLIGYTRVLLAAASLIYMGAHPKACSFLYVISCLLDAVDGQAARHFGQSSKFGAVLDMVTDRCTTACLLCVLCSRYQNWTILFQFLVSLDLASHYMHMYASLVNGSKSHKAIRESGNWILRQYYSNNVGNQKATPKGLLVLFGFCACNELFFVMLYLISFADDRTLTVSGAFLHRNRHILYSLALATFPICAGKQIINLVQMINASQDLAALDVAERRAAYEKTLTSPVVNIGDDINDAKKDK